MSARWVQRHWQNLGRDALSLSRTRLWEIANPEKRAASVRKWRGTKPKAQMLANAKARAKAAEVAFAITADDFDIPDTCPVLGIPLRTSYVSGRRTDNSPSLDRVTPAKGYVPGNVCVISMRANRLKSDATEREAAAIARYMARGGCSCD